MTGTGTVIPTQSLHEYFFNAVHHVAERQRFRPPEEVLAYLINMMTMFARTEAIEDRLYVRHGPHRSLVDQLNEAFSASSGTAAAHSLTRMGDAATFVGGFLYNSFARRMIDVDYYTEMAQRAYSTAAPIYAQMKTSRRAFAPTLEAMAENLPQVVDVLHEIGTNANSPVDMLRAYELFMKTNSKWAARILRENGIEPVRNQNPSSDLILN